MREVEDRATGPVEHVRDPLAARDLEGIGVEPLASKHLSELGQCVEGEGPARSVLRRAYIKAHDPGCKIEPVPCQRQDFGWHPPAREIGECHDVPEGLGKGGSDAFQLLTLEKALTGVVEP